MLTYKQKGNNMGMPSGFDLFIIIAAIVLLFGGKKIPELAKGLGQGIKNFKSAVKDDEKKDEEVASAQPSEKIQDNAKTKDTTATPADKEKTV